MAKLRTPSSCGKHCVLTSIGNVCILDATRTIDEAATARNRAKYNGAPRRSDMVTNRITRVCKNRRFLLIFFILFSSFYNMITKITYLPSLNSKFVFRNSRTKYSSKIMSTVTDPAEKKACFFFFFFSCQTKNVHDDHAAQSRNVLDFFRTFPP